MSLPRPIVVLTGVLHPGLQSADAERRWTRTGASDRAATAAVAEAAGLGPALRIRLGLGTSDDFAAADFWRFQAEDLDGVLLKGADLAMRAYPHPAARPMSDLDVLVADPAASARRLEAIGYVRASRNEAQHHLRMVRKGFVVELHTDLFDRPHGLRHDMDAIRDRATTVLDPVDACLHIAGHAVYSDALSTVTAVLRGALDLVLLIRATEPDPDTLWERARAWGLAPVWSEALRTCEWLFPGAISTAGVHAGWRGRILRANAIGALDERLGPPATITRALLAPTLGGSLAVLMEGASRRWYTRS